MMVEPTSSGSWIQGCSYQAKCSSHDDSCSSSEVGTSTVTTTRKRVP